MARCTCSHINRASWGSLKRAVDTRTKELGQPSLILVTQIAVKAYSLMRSDARGYPSWPEPKLHKEAGYISARPIALSPKASCDARSVHTFAWVSTYSSEGDLEFKS